MIVVETQIAIILIIIVIILQLRFFLKTKAECKKLSKIFPSYKNLKIIEEQFIEYTNNYDYSEYNDLTQEYNSSKTVKIIVVDYLNSEKLSEIIDTTNQYLKKNINASYDFNILRDIAERVSNSEESKVSANLALPLYIGLMGTFVGVIFGILNIIFSQISDSSSIITDSSIKSFLSGVLIAMIGSFVGLLLTTINNSYYFKDAKSVLDSQKNSYFNFLQVELLPTMENTLVKGLSDFKENLITFNREFSVNINDFKGTIPNITENLKSQKEFILKFEELKIPKLIKDNITLIEKLNKSASLFKDFSDYTISLNNSLYKSDAILDKLTNLLNRISNFEDNIKNVGLLIKESSENYANIGKYIIEKLDILQKEYQLIQTFIDKSEEEVKAITNESLKKIEQQHQLIKELLDKNEEKVKEVSYEYISRIQQLSQKLEKEFDNAFNFTASNPFNNLNLLKNINESLENISNKLILTQKQNDDSANLAELSDSLKSLSNAIFSLKRSIRPSIFKPVQFIKFIFSKNGY